MSNVFDPQSNAWICDTTAVITTEPTQILGWRWVSPTAAAGDLMKIGNNEGTPKYAIRSSAVGANWNDQMYFGGNHGRSYSGGFRVTVPSGELVVYIR